LLWPAENAVKDGAPGATVPLWSPRREFDAGVYAQAREAAAERQMEEYRRLFYVALTRAEDRLYIAGYRGKQAPRDGCWYSLAQNAFPAGVETAPFLLGGAPVTDAAGVQLMTRRLRHPQTVPPDIAPAPAETAADALRLPLPAFAVTPPAAEPVPPVPLAPSRPGEDEPAVKGPLGADEGWRFRRGVIVHHLLEILPQLPEGRWADTVAAWLARPALELPPEAQKAFAAEILAVLRHAD